MSADKEKSKQSNTLSPEEYSKGMNFIGQNLLSALVQTMQNLPAPLRSNDMALQGVAAFLGNTLYKQFPEDKEIRQQAFERFTKLVSMHLANIEEHSEVGEAANT